MASEPVTRDPAHARKANERIRELAVGANTRQPLMGLVCECSLEGCVAPIVTTLAEYETVRADPTHYFVSVGHVWDEGTEQVVIRTKQYWVVKRGTEGAHHP